MLHIFRRLLLIVFGCLIGYGIYISETKHVSAKSLQKMSYHQKISDIHLEDFLCFNSDLHMHQRTFKKCIQYNNKGAIVALNGDLVGICKQRKKKTYKRYKSSWKALNDPQQLVNLLRQRRKNAPPFIVNLGNHEFYEKSYKDSATISCKEKFIKALLNQNVIVVNSHLMNISSYQHLFKIGVRPYFLFGETLYLGYVTAQLRKDRKHFGEIPKNLSKEEWIHHGATSMAQILIRLAQDSKPIRRVVILCHADFLCHNGWRENEAENLIQQFFDQLKVSKTGQNILKNIQKKMITFVTVVGHSHTKAKASDQANIKYFNANLPIVWLKPCSLTGCLVLKQTQQNLES